MSLWKMEAVEDVMEIADAIIGIQKQVKLFQDVDENRN
jgi:hypothetical protein